MKKTINILIGGLSFQIEEVAYAALEKYLGEVKNRFAAYAEAAEIVSDIEDRMAEQLVAKLPHGQAISLALVEELITIMGRPEQIGEEGKSEQPGDKEEAAPKPPAAQKRLYRDLDDAILGGVCSGIAAYLGTDTVWVRLVFALTIFFGGFGVILYLILWVIVPPAQTAVEKLQMRGSPVNLKNLEQTLKDRVVELKKKDQSQVKRVIAAPFRVLGTGLRSVGRLVLRTVPVLFKLIGIAVVVLASLALAGLVFVVVSLLTNSASPYLDFPLKEIAAGSVYFAALVSAFVVVFVPIVFLMQLGVSLVTYRSAFRKMGSFLLLGLWVVAAAVFVNMAIKLAPQVENLVKTSPYFQTTTKEYRLAGFESVVLGGIDEAVLHPGQTYQVVAEGTRKDLDEAKVYVDNGTLKIRRNYPFRFCLFCAQNKIKLEVYAPDFTNLQASGASRLSTADTLKGKVITVTLSGVSALDGRFDFNSLKAELSGASKIKLAGTVGAADFTLSGASHAEAEEAAIGFAQVNLSGASDARFSQLDKLKIQASGASTVYYQSAGSLEEHYSGASRSVRSLPRSAPQGSQYQNAMYRFTFSYAPSFQLFEGEQASAAGNYYLPIQNYFAKNQGSRFLVIASLPKGTYPSNTDFDGAYFTVAIAPQLPQTDCLSFSSDGNVTNQHSQTVNGLEFAAAEASGAGMSHQAYDQIYHIYKNGACFELQTGVRTSGYGAADWITEQVNIKQVFGRLDEVLNTFTFLK